MMEKHRTVRETRDPASAGTLASAGALADTPGVATASAGALTIDVEDWFCAHNLSPPLSYDEWDTYDSRVESNTLRLMDLLDEADYRVTFFVLGWIAERYPDLVREIETRGHEVGTHGYSHRMVTEMSPDDFARDLDRALEVTGKLLAQPVIGYRAPSFTITRKTIWAVEILEKAGLKYSSSVYPVLGHPVYGIPDAPIEPYRIGEHLVEFPMSVLPVGKFRLPCSGGAYFRFLPYLVTRAMFRRIIKGGRPLNFYLHPWEIDPGQQRLPISLTKRLRHYYNLDRNYEKLQRLLSEFRFSTVKEVLEL